MFHLYISAEKKYIFIKKLPWFLDNFKVTNKKLIYIYIYIYNNNYFSNIKMLKDSSAKWHKKDKKDSKESLEKYQNICEEKKEKSDTMGINNTKMKSQSWLSIGQYTMKK